MKPENKRALKIAQVSHETESPIAHATESQRIRGKHRNITLAKVFDIDNLRQAEREARKGKSSHYGVRKWDKDPERNLMILQEELEIGYYHTTPPKMEERHCEHKVRVLSKVHYRDHVAHHALMRVIMPILERSYYYESAASIKERGIHYAMMHVRRYIDRHSGQDLWWSQVDFTKFYHHVKRQKLYDRLCKTFDDEGIRWMLHDVIWALGMHNGLEDSDGSEGLGIGLYPVQPLVNYYLNDFDRLVSRISGVKMFRYCDNVLLIGSSPDAVWNAIEFIKDYARETLEQPLHTNIGVQKLDDVHPIDYVGYLYYKDHTLVRKRLKQTFKRKFNHATDEAKLRRTLTSYKGWLEHADALHLWQKVTGMKRFSDLCIKRTDTTRDGKRYFDVPTVSASFLVNREIIVKDFIDDVATKNGDGRMCVLVEEHGQECKFLTNNPRLKDVLHQIKDMGELPFNAMFRSRNINGSKIEYYFE